MSLLKQTPRLHQCIRENRGEHIKLKGPSRSDIYLPKSYAPLLEALDGKRSLGKIWRDVAIPDPKLGLRDFMYLLSELDRIGCLENFSWEQDLSAQSHFRFRLSKIWLEKPITLFTQSLGTIGTKALPLVWIVAAFIVLLGIESFFSGRADIRPALDMALIPASLYLSFWLTASAFRFVQFLFQALTLMLGSGERTNASLEVGILGLRFRVHEEAVSVMSANKIFLFLLYLSWILIPLLTGLFTAQAVPQYAFWTFSIGVLLTILDLAPYRDSLFARYLSRILGPEDFHGLFMPYLYSSSFFSIFYRQRSLPKEHRMVLFASASVAWSLLCLNHATSMFSDSLAFMAQKLGKASFVQTLDVALFALIPVLLCADILFDLLAQLFGNTQFPLLSKLHSRSTQRMLQGGTSLSNQDLTSQVLSLDLFQGLSKELVSEIISHSSLVEVPSGRRILVQGTQTDELLILMEGQARIEKRDDYGGKNKLAIVGPIHVLGETAAIMGMPRQADVITQGPAKVLVVSGKKVQEVLKKTPGAQETFMERIALSHALSSSKTFRQLPQEVVKIISQKGVLEKVSAHQSLIREGESSRDFYMLVKGQLEVSRHGKHLAKFSSGETFGEISLMREVQRTATVSAGEEDCQVFRISAQPFLDILENNPELALAIEAQADFRSETYS